jgi:hypothetical protein
MKNKSLILNKILGQYFGYPECCINDFMKRNEVEPSIPLDISNDTRFTGSGYIPCRFCYNSMVNYTKEDIIFRLKRNIYINLTTMDFLKITYTKEFVLNSKKYNFPIQEYRDYLILKIKQFHFNEE